MKGMYVQYSNTIEIYLYLLFYYYFWRKESIISNDVMNASCSSTKEKGT